MATCTWVGCARTLGSRNVSGYCHAHSNQMRFKLLHTHLQDEEIAPLLAPTPHFTGEALVVSDLHIPWHDARGLTQACEDAALLGINTLVVAGDLLHMDTISKYVGVGKSVPVGEELRACKNVLTALEMVFKHIIIIPGNHDQRLEKLMGKMSDKVQGSRALELIGALLGVDDALEDKEHLAHTFLQHLFASPRVTIHPLPDLIINNTWLVQHPGTVSRVAPHNQRKMAEKHHLCILEGHSHLWGVGFDSSGKFVCMNTGHLSKDENFRYKRERPTTFPNTTRGYCFILQPREEVDMHDKGGYIVPVALHDRYFSLKELRARLQRPQEVKNT